MDIYDPQTLGIVVFGGFMVISAIGIALVSTFSMKETSYEEALEKQRKELAKTQPQQRTDKKKKDKAAEKKNRAKKKDEKPSLKPEEPEIIPDAQEETSEPQLVSPEPQVQEPTPAPATKSTSAPIKSTPAPVSKTAPASAPKPNQTSASKPGSTSTSKCIPPPATKPTAYPAANSTPVLATAVTAQASAPTRSAPVASTQNQASVPPNAAPAPTPNSGPSHSVKVEAPPAPSPKDKNKKKEKKAAKAEPAQVMAKPESKLETVVREVPVMAAPPVEPQKSTVVMEASDKTEKAKAQAPSKKKAGAKKNAESAVTVDAVEAPVTLPYKTLLSTLKNMVLSEGEAQKLIEILSEKAGMKDIWHKATQKGDPVAVLKKQLEDKDKQVASAQEDATAAKSRLKELTKELSAEKTKVSMVESKLSSQLSKREQEMIALQARMQASYKDHLAETQQLNAKIETLQEQLEKGPSTQLARLQQENSILRDAISMATSQAESKLNVKLDKLRQDCAKLNKELGEKAEALRSEEQLRKSLEAKASSAEKQLSQLQACQVSSEQALQRRLEEVSEELRQAQSSNSSLQSQLGQTQLDSAALREARGRVSAMEAELREKAGQAEALRAQLSQAETERGRVEERLNSVHKLLEASQSKEQTSLALVSELEDAKKSLKEKESRVSELENELSQLRDAVTRLEKDTTNAEPSADTLNENQSRITSLEDELRSLTEELNRVKTASDRTAEVEHLQNSLTEKEKQIASLQAEHEQLKEQHENSKLENTTKLEQMQSSLREREAQLSSLQEEIKYHNEQNASQQNAKSELVSLQNSLSEREQLIADLQQEVEHLKGEVERSKSKSDDNTTVFKSETISVLQSLFPQININSEQVSWLQEFSERAQEALKANEQFQEAQKCKVAELQERLSEAQEGQSTLQADCEQYRTVLAETEGMLKTLQKSVEEEEIGWRAKIAESEDQLRKALQKVQVLEETAESLRAENKNTEQLKEQVTFLEAQLEKQHQSLSTISLNHSEEMTKLKQLLSDSESRLRAAQAETHLHKEELAQVRQQLSEVMALPQRRVENGQPEPCQVKVQAELEQTVEKLQTEQALKQQLSEEVEQAQNTVTELQSQLERLRAAGEKHADTEDVTELKERLEKERKLTKDLGQAATKLQQLLRTSQDQLAKEKETVRLLQDQLQEKGDGVETKKGTSV